jgi:hypothetical protein
VRSLHALERKKPPGFCTTVRPVFAEFLLLAASGVCRRFGRAIVEQKPEAVGGEFGFELFGFFRQFIASERFAARS